MSGTVATTVDLVEIRATDPLGKPSRVDVERDAQGRLTSAVVRGVKVLGAKSINGLRGARRTRYADSALVEAARAYEGLKSYTDHPANRDPSGERSVSDLLGILENAKARAGDGVYADYVVLPHHPFAERFVWLAQNRPSVIGLSHNARGSGSVQGEEFVVESVSGARSADVVTEPATTQSLFESRQQEAPMSTPSATTPPAAAPAASPSPGAPATPPAGAAPTPPVALVEQRQPQANEAVTVDVLEARLKDETAARKKLEADVDTLTVQLATRARKDRVDALLLEARLPAHADTPVFRAQLLEAKDDAAAKALIDDRKRIAWHQNPSAQPVAAGAAPVETNEQFLESIRTSGR